MSKLLKRRDLFEALFERPEEACGYQCVDIENDDSYRHGNYQTAVFKDQNETFWKAVYSVSGDGENHELRDIHLYGEDIEVTEVIPKEVTKVIYIKA